MSLIVTIDTDKAMTFGQIGLFDQNNSIVWPIRAHYNGSDVSYADLIDLNIDKSTTGLVLEFDDRVQVENVFIARNSTQTIEGPIVVNLNSTRYYIVIPPVGSFYSTEMSSRYITDQQSRPKSTKIISRLKQHIVNGFRFLSNHGNIPNPNIGNSYTELDTSHKKIDRVIVLGDTGYLGEVSGVVNFKGTRVTRGQVTIVSKPTNANETPIIVKTKTDSTGRYRVVDIAPGNLTDIYASWPGYNQRGMSISNIHPTKKTRMSTEPFTQGTNSTAETE